MKCYICGGNESMHHTRDVPYAYKGEKTVLSGIEGAFCPTCGEAILDRENSMRVSSFVGDFMKHVNGSAKIANPVSEV